MTNIAAFGAFADIGVHQMAYCTFSARGGAGRAYVLGPPNGQCSLFWLGGAITVGFFLLPAIRATGPNGGQFATQVRARTRLMTAR